MDFMESKLLSNMTVKHLLDYAKKNNIQLWIAGGAITSLATGKHDDIADYDIYFKDKEDCAEMIRYMKDDNPHVSFVSSKSITYAPNSETTLQFIFYDFYETSKDIFNHFDFNCCMGAYNNMTGEFEYDDLFWLHNSQKFLGVNGDTKFPIISLLRLDKYKGKGYKTSQKEVLKLGLKVADLNIDSWEAFKEHIGNSYGFTLVDLEDCKDEPFNLDLAISKLVDNSENTHCPSFAYPHNVVDFVVLGETLEYTIINAEKEYLNAEARYVHEELQELADKGILEEEEVNNFAILGKDYYTTMKEDEVVFDRPINARWNKVAYLKEDLKNRTHCRQGDVLVKLKPIKEENVVGLEHGIKLTSFEVDKVICREYDVHNFVEGREVSYLPKVEKMKHAGGYSDEGWALYEQKDYIKGEIDTIREYTEETLKKCVIYSSTPRYAHKEFSGNVLKGGENLKPKEILLYMDGFNLCFGGSITLKEDGSFYGKYNTD